MSTGLVMIVKNEAHVIRRCLESVKPFVDWWLICDTGSTDETEAVARDVMGEMPGEYLREPWINFAYNRNVALDHARETAAWRSDDLVLTIDADEVLHWSGECQVDDGRDGYFIPVEYAGTSYQRLALIRLHRPWRWVGPVHEYLELEGSSTGVLDSPTIEVHHDGARAHDPETYRKDAALLEAHLLDNPGDPRTLFYLAQSWRDAGDLGNALRVYRQRVACVTGWEQERWFAAFQIARILEWTGFPNADVTAAYLDAWQMNCTRAEPLVELARYEREHERFAVALLYARAASMLGEPANGLFVDMSAYGAHGWDELALAAFWSGHYDEALDAARTAFDLDPEDERLRENLAHCERAVQ